MKPLALVLSAFVLLAAPLHAQVAAEADSLGKMSALKKKYAKEAQKPQGAEEAPAAAKPAGEGIAVPDLQNLLLQDPACAAKPEDTAELAPDLKGRYGLVACRRSGDLELIVLVPRELVKHQQVRYQGASGRRLLGGRFFGHYLVIEFEGQSQYLDLLQYKDLVGFPLSGYAAAGKDVNEFGDPAVFADALKRYAGFKDEALAGVSAYAAKAANGRSKIHLEAHQAAPEWVVFASFPGELWQLWPKEMQGLKR